MHFPTAAAVRQRYLIADGRRADDADDAAAAAAQPILLCPAAAAAGGKAHLMDRRSLRTAAAVTHSPQKPSGATLIIVQPDHAGRRQSGGGRSVRQRARVRCSAHCSQHLLTYPKCGRPTPKIPAHRLLGQSYLDGASTASDANSVPHYRARRHRHAPRLRWID